jgi:hypothetical protein
MFLRNFIQSIFLLRLVFVDSIELFDQYMTWSLNLLPLSIDYAQSFIDLSTCTDKTFHFPHF